jgi:hypothetical protein
MNGARSAHGGRGEVRKKFYLDNLERRGPFGSSVVRMVFSIRMYLKGIQWLWMRLTWTSIQLRLHT